MVMTKKWMYKKIKIPFKKNGISLDLEKLKVELMCINLEEPYDGKYSLNFFAQNIPNFPQKDNLYLISYSPSPSPCLKHNCHAFLDFGNDNGGVLNEFLGGQFDYFDYESFLKCHTMFGDPQLPLIWMSKNIREKELISPFYMNIDFKDGCVNFGTAKKCLINGIILVSKILMEKKKEDWNLVDIEYLKCIQVDFGLNYLEVEDFVEKMSNISLFNENDVLYKCIYYNYNYSWFDSKRFVKYGLNVLRHELYNISNFLLKYQFHANWVENRNFSKHQDIRMYGMGGGEFSSFDECLNKLIHNGYIIYLVSLCDLTGEIIIFFICNEKGSNLLNKNWFSNKECCLIKQCSMDLYNKIVKIALYIDYSK